MNVIDCLRQRGLIDALTSEDLRTLTEKPIKLYVGFDPTADSLHLGNLMGIMVLAWFQRFGHEPVVLLGGATGRIGDPSGKSIERPLLDNETLAKNVKGIGRHFEQILQKKPQILNNNDWLSSIGFIDFLRDVGKHFRVNNMLTKESVRARLESEEGISFTEFSYQLLQAYDFYHLFKEKGIILQMGGSDQWGNITPGIELIRKTLGKSAYGATWPLLTRSDGKKFGKSEEGAVWLAKEKFSPYKFYQYLLGVPDADVIKLMRFLTFMDLSEIEEYEKRLSEPNIAQKKLAEELTRIVHGEEGLQAALKVTEGIAPGAEAELNPEVFAEIAADMPNAELAKDEIIGQKLVDVAVKVGVLTSKSEAVRLIQNGGVYLNNKKIEDVQFRFEEGDLIGGKYLLLGIGKKKKLLINVK